MPVGHDWDWGCNSCPDTFETLTEAFRHARDAHDVNPFDMSKR